MEIVRIRDKHPGSATLLFSVFLWIRMVSLLGPDKFFSETVLESVTDSTIPERQIFSCGKCAICKTYGVMNDPRPGSGAKTFGNA